MVRHRVLTLAVVFAAGFHAAAQPPDDPSPAAPAAPPTEPALPPVPEAPVVPQRPQEGTFGANDFGNFGGRGGFGGFAGIEGLFGSVPTDSYRVIWLPTERVTNENGRHLGFVEQSLTASSPLYTDGSNVLTARVGVGEQMFQTNALLPGSGQPSPTTFGTSAWA